MFLGFVVIVSMSMGRLYVEVLFLTWKNTVKFVESFEALTVRFVVVVLSVKFPDPTSFQSHLTMSEDEAVLVLVDGGGTGKEEEAVRVGKRTHHNSHCTISAFVIRPCHTHILKVPRSANNSRRRRYS